MGQCDTYCFTYGVDLRLLLNFVASYELSSIKGLSGRGKSSTEKRMEFKLQLVVVSKGVPLSRKQAEA